MRRDGKRGLSRSNFTSEGFVGIFSHDLGHYVVENPDTLVASLRWRWAE